MTNKAGMALTGLALGVVILSGCTNAGRQTYTGPVNHNRTPSTAGKNDWSNTPAARQQVPLGAQTVGNQQQPGFPAPTQTTGATQYPYPNSYPLPNGAVPVQPAGLPTGTSGQNFRQPAGGVNQMPTSTYHSVPAPGTPEVANPNPGGPSLTSSPAPTLGSYQAPYPGPMPARTIPATPLSQTPSTSYPAANFDGPAEPLPPPLPLR